MKKFQMQIEIPVGRRWQQAEDRTNEKFGVRLMKSKSNWSEIWMHFWEKSAHNFQTIL